MKHIIRFIKWFFPWDQEVKWLLVVLGACVVAMILFASGCSTTEMIYEQEVVGEFSYDINQRLICSPADAELCIGFETEEL
jgi:hypothetical protein|tara:strand:+ start:1171 stop:1413 length:243 start_codon:yes stop_codon:yes gene_type:complete